MAMGGRKNLRGGKVSRHESEEWGKKGAMDGVGWRNMSGS